MGYKKAQPSSPRKELENLIQFGKHWNNPSARSAHRTTTRKKRDEIGKKGSRAAGQLIKTHPDSSSLVSVSRVARGTAKSQVSFHFQAQHSNDDVIIIIIIILIKSLCKTRRATGRLLLEREN
jgi:hypothetical protein